MSSLVLQGALVQCSAVTHLPLTLPCRNLHPDCGWSCHDVRGVPGMLRCYSGVSVPSGNGKRQKALHGPWHCGVRTMAVPSSLETFATKKAGRMCEHVGGN